MLSAGDLLDEGKWSSDTEFHDTVLRFQRIFNVGSENRVEVVVGNHDIGFHYMFVIVYFCKMKFLISVLIDFARLFVYVFESKCLIGLTLTIDGGFPMHLTLRQ